SPASFPGRFPSPGRPCSCCIPRFELAGQPSVNLGNDVVAGSLAGGATLDRLGEGGIFLAELVEAAAGLANGLAPVRLRNQGLVDGGVIREHLSASLVVTPPSSCSAYQ